MAEILKVTGCSYLNMRTEPETEARIIKTLSRGDEVEFSGVKKDGWYRVSSGAKTGYCKASYLKKDRESKQPKQKKKTKAIKAKLGKQKLVVKTAAAKIKKAPKQTGTLGRWGSRLIFEVSDKRLLAPSGIEKEVSGRWAKHAVIGKVPHSEYQGKEQTGVKMTVRLSAEHGVKPRDMLEAIDTAVREGEIAALTIGGTPMMHGHKCYIESSSEAYNRILVGGRLASANVDLAFKEYK